LFTKVVGDNERVRGMMQLALDIGITREGLYKAIGEQGKRLRRRIRKCPRL
jgi:DNA-binding phage protein